MGASKNQRVIIQELARVGLEPHAIAGIMANLQHENSFNTTVNNGDGGQASGIAQWHPDRFARVIRVAEKMGLKPTDIRAQARTLALSIKDENQSGKSGTVTVDSLNALGSPAAVAGFFDDNYERSDGSTRQSRQQAAKNYIKMANRFSTGEGVTGDSEPVRKVKGSKDGKMTWVPKVGNQVSQDFTGPGNYESGNHSGVDIPGNEGGQPIRWAPKVSGKVIGWGDDQGNGKNSQGGAYGNHVVIKDDMGRTWLLAHMQTTPPAVGTRLNQGDQIGKVGNTGNSDGAHLHIEMSPPGVDYRSGGPVKRAKLVFKVGTNGQTYDKDFKPVEQGDYLESIGLSGEAINRPGNEELQQLIDDAEAGDWTTQEFTRRFKASQWYRERAGSQRQFDMMQDTDQQQSIKQATAEAKSMAAQLGIQVDNDEARKLAIKMKRDGFTQEQALWWLSKRFEYSPEQAMSGVAADYEDTLKERAREYGIRIDDSQFQKWIQAAIGRGVDIDTYEEEIRAIAYQQNPNLREAYDRGLSTRDALLGKLSTAANILGLSSVDEIDLSDPKWRNVFDVNGNEMSDSDWVKKIKTDESFRYGWTENGMNEAKTIGRNLMRAMGGLSRG